MVKQVLKIRMDDEEHINIFNGKIKRKDLHKWFETIDQKLG